MLVLKPGAPVGALIDRMESEVAMFVQGLEASEDMHDEDAREHTAYAAALRSGIDGLRSSGAWNVHAAERRHARAFLRDAATEALGSREWSALACYADFLRRLDADS